MSLVWPLTKLPEAAITGVFSDKPAVISDKVICHFKAL
jgi:hypothetical protein